MNDCDRDIYQQQQPNIDDSGSFGWFILGFIIPLVGLILFLVWTPEKPKSAKMAMLGFVIGTIFYIILYIILMIILVMILLLPLWLLQW